MSRFHVVSLIGLSLAVVALRLSPIELTGNGRFVDATTWTSVHVKGSDEFPVGHVRSTVTLDFDQVGVEPSSSLLPFGPPPAAVATGVTGADATALAAPDPHATHVTPHPHVSSALPDSTDLPNSTDQPNSPNSPDPVRGLYLSGWVAGHRLPETVEYMLRHDLNTIVIDIKDIDGRLSFAMPGTVANRLGANAYKMGSPERVRQLLSELKREDIFVIGRLVLFQDNFLPHRRPQWALRTPDGELWQDASGGYWLDPTRPEVLDYHVEIAVAAAAVGFDEIQFDYVRYPGQRVPGYNDGTALQRIATITHFATAARERIQAQVDVPVSGAIYGIVAVNEADHHLGQNLNSLTKALDYISPMFYPSHYLPGDFGLRDPNAEPYKTLFASTAAALARTNATDWPNLRPWIQSFFEYEQQQVEDQIRALIDLGVDSFLVWNPSGRYIEGVDYHLRDEDVGRLAKSPFRRVLYPLMSPSTGIFVVDPSIKIPVYPGDNGPGEWHVQASRHEGGYRMELWEERAPQAAAGGHEDRDAGRNADRDADPEAGPGADRDPIARRRIVALQRSRVSTDGASSSIEGRNTFRRDQGGIALTWVEQNYEWYLWAPSFTDVLTAQQSLQTLPAPLF